MRIGILTNRQLEAAYALIQAAKHTPDRQLAEVQVQAAIALLDDAVASYIHESVATTDLDVTPRFVAALQAQSATGDQAEATAVRHESERAGSPLHRLRLARAAQLQWQPAASTSAHPELQVRSAGDDATSIGTLWHAISDYIETRRQRLVEE